MRFIPEPAHQHGTIAKTGILLVNLGTPDATDAKSVRRYLREFLHDKRVIEEDTITWKFVLNADATPGGSVVWLQPTIDMNR